MSDEQHGETPPSEPSGSETAGPSFQGMPYAVLRRYVSGASDGFERRRVETWAASSPERCAYLTALVEGWRTSGLGVTESEQASTDAAWAVLRSHLGLREDAVPSSPVTRSYPVVVDLQSRKPAGVPAALLSSPRRRRRFAPLAAAAAVVLVAGASYLFQDRLGSERTSDRPVAGRAVEVREYVTAAGQRGKLELGDGTMITVAPSSRLRFDADFGVHGREVELEGEAYFEVAHDSRRPFVVRAAGTRTVDLGTAFALRAYPDDETVQVVVTEGSVALGADGPDSPPPAVLTEGQLGRLARSSDIAIVRNVDPTDYTSWLTGSLIFDNARLPEVIADLQRWYAVEVRLADASLEQEVFTARFRTESFAEVLTTLTTVLQLRVEHDGDTIIMHRLAS